MVPQASAQVVARRDGVAFQTDRVVGIGGDGAAVGVAGRLVAVRTACPVSGVVRSRFPLVDDLRAGNRRDLVFAMAGNAGSRSGERCGFSGSRLPVVAAAGKGGQGDAPQQKGDQVTTFHAYSSFEWWLMTDPASLAGPGTYVASLEIPGVRINPATARCAVAAQAYVAIGMAALAGLEIAPGFARVLAVPDEALA